MQQRAEGKKRGKFPGEETGKETLTQKTKEPGGEQVDLDYFN